jgi:Alpha-acetolactate decarboxylase
MRGWTGYKRFLSMGVAIFLFVALGMGVAIFLFAGRSQFPSSPSVPLSSCRGRITQVSVIIVLMIGRYDGVMPIPELLRCGALGLGTLDHLDGELIVLDGRAYQVCGDGVVVEVGPDRSTPLAIVTPFEPDGEFPCPRVGSLSDEPAVGQTVIGGRAMPQRPPPGTALQAAGRRGQGPVGLDASRCERDARGGPQPGLGR